MTAPGGTAASSLHEPRRVREHRRAALTSSIAHAIVLKHNELFFLCESDGNVRLNASNGLGFYYHDCRYMNAYELRLGEGLPDGLAATAAAGFAATFVLTNRAIHANDTVIEEEQVGLTWNRVLDADGCALHDTMTITNFGEGPIGLPLTIALGCQFESIFEVRGIHPAARGTLHDPEWIKPTALEFRYDGADGLHRAVVACFDPAPSVREAGRAGYIATLAPHASSSISLSLYLSEAEATASRANSVNRTKDVGAIRRTAQRASDEWMKQSTWVRSDGAALNRAVERSLRDLHLLRTALGAFTYFAAGVPWYATLFGRDSIISAIEALAFRPDRAEDTLRLLAHFQGTRDDDWRDEAPGKIMHELRVGELAHLNEIPQTPYYGSVDATPLFLILMGQHARWTGRLDVFADLKPNVEAALQWIDRRMAGNGYLTYAKTSAKGLDNQGWKDSSDAIMNRDGSLARPPIALVEVQGYVYFAKKSMADLYERSGDHDTASRLRAESEALRSRFEHDFWIDDLGTYALAIQQRNEPAAVVASNVGQALWTGIVTPDRAASVARRLMQSDMFNGWGIRTLSSQARRYNPIGYHTGTVWPHDNAIIAAGFCRYGCQSEGQQLFEGILAAATHFDHDRLPEVFAGFSVGELTVPVHYPVACHPQAWAAAAVPFMLQSALGLEANGFERQLRVVSPFLPADVRALSIDRLRVGGATARLRYVRNRDGQVVVADCDAQGDLDIIVG